VEVTDTGRFFFPFRVLIYRNGIASLGGGACVFSLGTLVSDRLRRLCLTATGDPGRLEDAMRLLQGILKDTETARQCRLPRRKTPQISLHLHN